MAISLAQLANTIMTSLHGRRIGLDSDGYLVGPPGLRKQVTAATSDTTGTALPNNGIVTVTTTTNDGWTLTDPEVGVEVRIVTGSSSTGTHAVTPAAATIISSNGIAGSSMTLVGAGAGIHLIGLSTASWGVLSRQGSTTNAGFYSAVSS